MPDNQTTKVNGFLCSAVRILKKLRGHDAYSQRMKAIRDLDKCHYQIKHILGWGIFDQDFKDDLPRLTKALDDVCSEIREHLVYKDWWSLVDELVKDKKRPHA